MDNVSAVTNVLLYIPRTVVALCTSLISVWVILARLATHGMINLTHGLVPEIVLWLFGALSATLCFLQTFVVALVAGCFGLPSSWTGLLDTGKRAIGHNSRARYRTASTLLATFVTIWEVLVPPIPITVDEDANSSPWTWIKSMLFREPCKF